ncbi:HAE1 family hydrophobic/amphiphilic exporter-1 [Clostridium acetobutylicum]|uniref:Cation efflux system protein, AcrB/AcrF/AcrD family n=1 Tax=Clostridium acetobutylicum (strain ATCC 824 / DSM 792 / JCM 1419 / IAM 19013 / LMG 5710 / NBRC 13948 / NRRL B-527 / VKM B-1787 / 2291 / W) TaxID=272562 RepID=Q97M30_CLOAB|nr:MULTISPECIES: efflux RND transporter permease subunit [Clostridium]AAK78350.1 Cation efflux system protein, AcrB/AcrF/AcrD family [Clostridium acetobutylicum ATCC 824]ADZ19419.1 Cation efflux system protein, AcrB/AcrF/AcrD family [Clostridium acetobutylicum EA 2018]AEI34245.1 AcrB/AcrD/AcrF family cation efflux protein [Clostridium acetobutylicum DSM 1731]AWV80074.1 AcrB/AcrD/AcrF family protein [Clostridium acetobutylicum]MBC2395896.1 efflux RND transporter permease subunit [Clostridium ac
MNRLTKFSLKNMFVIFLIIILITVGGLYSTKTINMESMPNINIPVVTAVTVYPGASPEQVASDISRPVQKAISGIQGIQDVKTTSNENVSVVVAQFDYSADMDKAQKNVEDAVNKIKFPESAKKSTISRISMGSAPIMTYSINSTKSIDELTKIVNDKIEPKLSGISGVSSVEMQGTSNDDIYVKVDNDKLKNNGLTLSDVKTALQGNNISIPAGSVNVGDSTLPIEMTKKLYTTADIEAMPIAVIPNQTKVVGEAFQQVQGGMTQLGQAVGQLGQNMGQLGQAVGQMGQGMGQMGQMVGGNTQSIAILNQMQKAQSQILLEQEVLTNPTSSAQDKTKAQATITAAQGMLQQAQAQLDKLMGAQIESSKALSSSAGSLKTAAPSQGTAKSSSAPSLGSSSSSSSSNASQIKVVYLKDVATVTRGSADKSYFIRSNSKNSIILNIYKTDDGNTVNVAKDVASALEDLQKSNNGIKFNKISDSSKYVKDSVNGMVREGVLGALFAIVVIAFFLKNIKATIIAVVSIPLSILIALILLPRFGITLNIMSLSGMAVAVGRIVDDSIVVIENIHRRILKDDVEKGKIIQVAADEVSSAITSSTVTTVAVFLPLAMISGMVGKVFVPFAVTVVICILASLLVAVTVVPVMSRLMILNEKPKPEKGEGAIVGFYKKVLNGALNHRAAVMGVSVVLFVLSLFLIKGIGIQFLPSSSSNVLNGTITTAPGTSAEKTNEEALKFEKYLLNRSDVKTVVSSIGDNSSSSSSAMSMQGGNSGKITIVLKDGVNNDKSADEIIKKATDMSSKNTKFAVTVQSFTSGSKDNVEIVVNGNNMKDITAAASKATEALKGVKELTNVNNTLSSKKPEISVAIDSAKAANEGLSPMIAAGMVQGIMNYNNVTTIQSGKNNVNVYLGYDNKDINSLDKVKTIQLQGASGSFNLSDIADVQVADGPVSVEELNGNQYASITADVKTKDTQTASKNAMEKIKSIKGIPNGVTFTQNGSAKSISDSFSQMGMAMLVAVFMVYIVMVLAFGEPKAPFAILFSLPFAAIGAIVALFITRQPLGIPGLIGMLMLIGIVVTNAIVLLDRVQSNRKKGMLVREALIEAGAIRMRPIFMTAIATVMALTPLAAGFSEGAVISQGLGIVVIGGLVVSTILTLIIVPVMYSVLERD